MASQLKIDIIAGIDKLSASLKDVENKFSALGDKMKKVGVTLSVAVTAPITAIGAVAANEFASVEKGLREINSLFGLTGKEAEKNFGMLSKVAEDASKELGILQSDVVPAMYNAISAGVPSENIFDFIRVAGKAAIGGVTDLNTAVDGLTSIINAFGLEMSDAGAVADSMFAAVQGGKTTFEELSNSIFNIAPAAAAANVSMQEVNAAIAALTAGGTPTTVATTQIRAALTGLQAPSEELNAIFQRLGFQNAQLAIESKGLQFALNAVKEASNGNNGVLKTLLGSTEAVAAAQVLAGTGAAKFSDELDRQANSAGAAAQAAAEIDKSFGREMERTKVAANNLAIAIGKNIAPALSAMNKVLEKVINFFSNLSPTTQKVVVVVAALAASIGPLLLGIGSIISIIPTLTAGLAAVKFAVAAISGPVGIVIAAVTALAIAIISNWDTIKETVQKLANTFIEFGVKILESIKPFADFLNMGSLVEAGIQKLNQTLAENKAAQNTQAASLEKTSISAEKVANKIDTVTDSTALLTEEQKKALEIHKDYLKFSKEYELALQDITYSTKNYKDEIAAVAQTLNQPSQSPLLSQIKDIDAAFNAFKSKPTTTGPALDTPNLLEGIEYTPEMDAADKLHIQNAELLNQKFAEQRNLGMEMSGIFGPMLANSFTQMFETGKFGFASLLDGLKKMAIQLAATAAAAFALNLLLGGVGMAGFGKGSSGFKNIFKGLGGGGLGGLMPFANGGIVSGPTPALVGEYTGARTNPEVIAPLSKLQNMMGGNVTFSISGDNLVGTLNRANKTRARKF
jgi:TP901 family phage tail tape measure protein